MFKTYFLQNVPPTLREGYSSVFVPKTSALLTLLTLYCSKKGTFRLVASEVDILHPLCIKECSEMTRGNPVGIDVRQVLSFSRL